MFAVIEQGGRQYKVAQGDVVDIELTNVADDATGMEFDKVLFIGNGAESKIGAPYVAGAKVTGKFATTAAAAKFKTPKIYGMYYRPNKNSKRKYGHRQNLIRLTIDSIQS